MCEGGGWWVVGNLISWREIPPSVTVTHRRISDPGKAGGKLERHPWCASTNLFPFVTEVVFYGLGSVFMNWNSLNKMVLWCFNVTVPDPDLLRCYQGSETTTNQKRGGLQSRGFFSPPYFGAVSLDLCLPCYHLLWAVFLFRFIVLPLVAKHGKASRKGSSLPDCGGGWPAWLGWCSSSNSVFSGLKREEGLRFFFLFFLFSPRKGTRVLCLFQHGRHSHRQGHRFSRSPGCRVDLSQSPQVLSPGVGQAVVGRAPSLAPHSLCPVLLLPLTGHPSCSDWRKEFSLLTRCRFLVGAILNFLLGPQKLMFFKNSTGSSILCHPLSQ